MFTTGGAPPPTPRPFLNSQRIESARRTTPKTTTTTKNSTANLYNKSNNNQNKNQNSNDNNNNKHNRNHYNHNNKNNNHSNNSNSNHRNTPQEPQQQQHQQQQHNHDNGDMSINDKYHNDNFFLAPFCNSSKGTWSGPCACCSLRVRRGGLGGGCWRVPGCQLGARAERVGHQQHRALRQQEKLEQRSGEGSLRGDGEDATPTVHPSGLSGAAHGNRCAGCAGLCKKSEEGRGFLTPAPTSFNAENDKAAAASTEQLRIGVPALAMRRAGQRNARLRIGRGLRLAITRERGDQSRINGELSSVPEGQAIAHDLDPPGVADQHINVHVNTRSGLAADTHWRLATPGQGLRCQLACSGQRGRQARWKCGANPRANTRPTRRRRTSPM